MTPPHTAKVATVYICAFLMAPIPHLSQHLNSGSDASNLGAPSGHGSRLRTWTPLLRAAGACERNPPRNERDTCTCERPRYVGSRQTGEHQERYVNSSSCIRLAPDAHFATTAASAVAFPARRI
eukprot:6197690-Pleurochrysis_carterae.AAC.3